LSSITTQGGQVKVLLLKRAQTGVGEMHPSRLKTLSQMLSRLLLSLDGMPPAARVAHDMAFR
jgi:hypothetical protein